MRDGKYVIVHVDDSMTARELVSEALFAAGCEVHSAEDAEDLEDLLSAEPELLNLVDLMVLDMEMPDMTGAQVGVVMESVYNELSNVPFVIFSGKGKDFVERMINDVADLSASFRKNYRGYMGKKPGSEEELVELVKEILEG